MHLLLVRHGESSDNVAGLLAGSRDAPLTAHGVLQARRLGQHLASRRKEIGPVVHVFSSDLRRAAWTAEEVVRAQDPVAAATPGRLEVRTLSLLREKDFGALEGTAYGKRRRAEPRPARRGAAAAEPETHERMAARMARFANEHLLPLLARRLAAAGDAPAPRETVVVVAHGIILDVLTRVLLPPAERARLSGPQPRHRPSSPSLVSLRNTAYVEMAVFPSSASAAAAAPGAAARVDLRVVSAGNSRHLDGLKKTRGGIGSAEFDSRQKTMHSFLAAQSHRNCPP